MHTAQHPKNWLVILLILSLIVFMLMVIKHKQEDKNLQQKIYGHSEIKDTV